MSLAIVIPYYNIEYFNKTLSSLSCQTDKRFKVYIGNNNSPNSPRKLIESYADKLDIVYKEFKNERNPITLGEQFFQCVKMISDEEWFLILGDDDILGPDVISDFYRHLPQINDNRINVIKYSSILINQYGDPFSKAYQYGQIENSTDLYLKKITNRGRSSLSEHIFRTNQFVKHKIPYYPLAWHTDDMMILLYSDFDKVYCISDSTVMIRVSGKNISGWVDKYSKEKVEASIIFYSELITQHREKFNFEDLKILYHNLLRCSLNIFNHTDIFEKIKIGIDLFGLEYINHIISSIKYPIKFNLLEDEIKEYADNSYINTFCLYGNGSHQKEFSRKREFKVSWIKSDSPIHKISQEHLNSILSRSIKNEDDLIIICFDSYHFKTDYSKYELFKYVLMAYFYKADILFLHGEKIDFMCEIQDRLCWANNVQESNFIILYKKFFNKLSSINYSPLNNFSEIISPLSPDKFLINQSEYP